MATVAEIKISLSDAGQVQVEGPLTNKLLCYGLLEMAKDVVIETCAAAERKIQPASMGALAHFAKPKD